MGPNTCDASWETSTCLDASPMSAGWRGAKHVLPMCLGIEGVERNGCWKSFGLEYGLHVGLLSSKQFLRSEQCVLGGNIKKLKHHDSPSKVKSRYCPKTPTSWGFRHTLQNSSITHNSSLFRTEDSSTVVLPNQEPFVVNNLWLLLKSVPSVWRAQSCWQPAQPWSPDRRLIKQKATETTTSPVSCRNSDAFVALLEKCQSAKTLAPASLLHGQPLLLTQGTSKILKATPWQWWLSTLKGKISMSASNLGILAGHNISPYSPFKMFRCSLLFFFRNRFTVRSLSCPTLRAQDAGDLVDSDIERVLSSRRERFACNTSPQTCFKLVREGLFQKEKLTLELMEVF